MMDAVLHKRALEQKSVILLHELVVRRSSIKG